VFVHTLRVDSAAQLSELQSNVKGVLFPVAIGASLAAPARRCCCA